jgi:hypothetical protein
MVQEPTHSFGQFEKYRCQFFFVQNYFQNLVHLHISKGKRREGKFSHKPTVLQSLDLLRPSIRGWLRRVSQKIHLQDHLSHHPPQDDK